MAEKDITEKHLEAYNDVAADIANVLLFGGKRLIQVIKHVDETLKLMSAITGDRRFEQMYNARVLTGEDKEPKMERMLDEIEERGIQIGEARGRQLEKKDNIARMADYILREHPGMTREQAVETAASILR